jgi:AcrR family transcriptional regulator
MAVTSEDVMSEQCSGFFRPQSSEQCSDSKGRSGIVGHMAATTPAPPATEGRRARQRRELLAAIEVEARRLLEEGGAGKVSMRAIARAVGLGPASLYTYFDRLDDVFTLLLLASYESLAAATATGVDAFADDPPADRAFAGILAHRRWALAHRNEFNLLFTDVLPGYAAPPGGPTVDAQVQVFQPIVDALTEVGPLGTDLTVEQAGIVVWCAFHGAVALEVNHHLDWLDDPAAAHETTVRRAFASIGAPAPAKTLRKRFDRWATHP